MPGKASPTERSAVLFGYAGVLSVEGHEWGTDPFVLIEEGDKLFGRGTCDNERLCRSLRGADAEAHDNEAYEPGALRLLV